MLRAASCSTDAATCTAVRAQDPLDIAISLQDHVTNTARMEAAMTVTFNTATVFPTLNVLGEHLRPLVPEGLSIEVFETTGPEQAGPPPHRHPWDEVYLVLEGTLDVYDGDVWRQAEAGTCACVPAGQVHAYRNGSPGCRFLTLAGPGHARRFFEQMDAEVTGTPPDLATVMAVAARNELEIVAPG
jgi:quercetin dioxygenase-like cupin family protein